MSSRRAITLSQGTTKFQSKRGGEKITLNVHWWQMSKSSGLNSTARVQKSLRNSRAGLTHTRERYYTIRFTNYDRFFLPPGRSHCSFLSHSILRWQEVEAFRNFSDNEESGDEAERDLKGSDSDGNGAKEVRSYVGRKVVTLNFCVLSVSSSSRMFCFFGSKFFRDATVSEG